ncbi:MAG: ABC transporter ATP-binding protein [Caldiserica bacterium]|jgi:peptide/nickel transport system ATP-binding protein|nr:ABC transporter ATP-binding protein [Caldisericota bacterium]
MSEINLLHIENLSVSYRIYRGLLKVLDGVSLEVRPGEKVALVGETGCGKTTTVKSILNILPRQAIIHRGKVFFKGKDVLRASDSDLNYLRRRGVSMIFQDPTASLFPIFTVGDQISTVIRAALSEDANNTQLKESSLFETALKALRAASLPDPERILRSYPFQLSGGMRQRVCIAMALATPRELLIADEPTTNLDVTIQDQVLRLISNMVAEKNISLILITHSLGVAREIADRIYIMYAGSIIEMSQTDDLFENPLHPYSRALLNCVPKLTGEGIGQGVPGHLPDYLNPPLGCRFEPRCPKSMPICKKIKPSLKEVAKGHFVSCFLYDSLGG